MKQIEAKIMDTSYLLACPEGDEAQLLQAVQQVDAAMCKIRDGGKVRARERIAVLAALNLASDWIGQSHRQASLAAQPTPAQADQLTNLLARLNDALSRDNQLI